MLPSTRIGNFGRAAIAVYLAVWALIMIGSWIYWTEMNVWLKATIVILEVLFIPDVHSIQEVFGRNDKGR